MVHPGCNELVSVYLQEYVSDVCRDGSVRDYNSYIEDVHYMVVDTEYCMHIYSAIIVTLLLGHSHSFCC